MWPHNFFWNHFPIRMPSGKKMSLALFLGPCSWLLQFHVKPQHCTLNFNFNLLDKFWGQMAVPVLLYIPWVVHALLPIPILYSKEVDDRVSGTIFLHRGIACCSAAAEIKWPFSISPPPTPTPHVVCRQHARMQGGRRGEMMMKIMQRLPTQSSLL